MGTPTARGEIRTTAPKREGKLWRPDVLVRQTDELSGDVDVAPVDSRTPRVWSYAESDLRAALRLVGVEDAARWSCNCGLSTCFTFALYGAGVNPVTGHACLWITLSTTYVNDGQPVMVSPETVEEIDAIPDKVSNANGGGILRLLFLDGLDNVLKAAFHDLTST